MGSLHMSPIYRVSIVALLHSQYASEHREESQLNNDSAHAKKEIFRKETYISAPGNSFRGHWVLKRMEI